MVGVEHLPACGGTWPVLSERIADTHGTVHRCIMDVGHAQRHLCACGATFNRTPISAVMESDKQ